MDEFTRMPIDKTEISTSLCLHPDFVKDPQKFILERGKKILSYFPPKTNVRGHGNQSRIDALRYKGLSISYSMQAWAGLHDVTIEFNPSQCLFGHNGRIVSYDEFLDALILMAEALHCLLKDENDWKHLVPGLEGSNAYWSYLEIPFQCCDPDGSLLHQFRQMKHPKINVASKHWPTMIKAGAKDGDLNISIYDKSVEMLAKNKLNAKSIKFPGSEPVSREEADKQRERILRFEVQLKNNKLLEYVGYESNSKTDASAESAERNLRNVRIIDGKRRLVRFYSSDLFAAHRRIFSELQGVYQCDAYNEVHTQKSASGKLQCIARLLVELSKDSRVSLMARELHSMLKLHFFNNKGDGSLRTINTEISKCLSLSSKISSMTLFSDEAYANCRQVVNIEIENTVRHFDPRIPSKPFVGVYAPDTKSKLRPPERRRYFELYESIQDKEDESKTSNDKALSKKILDDAYKPFFDMRKRGRRTSKTTNAWSTSLPACVVNMRVSVPKLPLNPEFTENPTGFAYRHGVDLVHEGSTEMEARWKADPFIKKGRHKRNYHLVKINGISLYSEDSKVSEDSDDSEVSHELISVSLRPSILMTGTDIRVLDRELLLTSLSMMREQVGKLLLNPDDVDLLIPGLTPKCKGAPYWSEITMELLGLKFPLLELTDMLYDARDVPLSFSEQQIIFSSLQSHEIELTTSERHKPPLCDSKERANLFCYSTKLRSGSLVANFRDTLGACFNQIDETPRLISFKCETPGQVLLNEIRKLSGFAVRQSGEKLQLSCGSAIALMAAVTGIPTEEVEELFACISGYKSRTLKEIRAEVEQAQSRFETLNVVDVIHEANKSFQFHSMQNLRTHAIHPGIEQIYG